MKTWKTWPGIDCPDCGSSAEIYSHEKFEDGSFESGDRLRCSDPECPRHTEDLGTVVAVGDDDLMELFDPWPIGDDDKPYRPEREEEKP